MEIINKGCTLNIPIDGVQLNLQFVLIQDFDKLKAQYFNQNNLIKIFNTKAEAAQELGLDSGSITKVCKGQRKTCGGFIWKEI